MSGSHKGKISGCFFQPNRLISYKISRAMHMHALSSHILYTANAHTLMSSQNRPVPDFMSSGKTPGKPGKRRRLCRLRHFLLLRRHPRRKNNEAQALFLGPGPRNSLFSVFISHVPRTEGRCHGRHEKASLCPRHVHIERNGGRDGELTVSHLREEINNERQNPHHNEDSKHSLPHDS